MKIVFIFVDVLTVLFASSLALQLGSNYRPNLFVFFVAFLVSRLLLQWLLFNSFIHREFPLTRSLVQFVIILLILPFILFGTSSLPFLSKTFTPLLEHPFYFYYLIIPSIVLVISILFQIFFKLESWTS